ncbi:MAG TPA: TIGR04211 family SH3 domain-containing protein [Porticoccus sp.]|nr:TIGR04211 family SH3 domain-containing protein [Porticoccus sp.]
MLILLAVSSQLYSEETVYIRDQLYVPLRSGTTMQHRIVHKGLVSGTPLTVIETSEDKKYSHVRTKRGTEGWIQTQYLSPEPAGRDLVKVANKTIATLEQKNNELSQQLNNIKSKQKSTQTQLTKLTSNNNQVTKELENIKTVSAGAIQLNSDNKILLEENQKLKNELDVLNTEQQRLTDNHENDAFLNGAFAVLIGVMITLLVPRAWPKKSTDWA